MPRGRHRSAKPYNLRRIGVLAGVPAVAALVAVGAAVWPDETGDAPDVGALAALSELHRETEPSRSQAERSPLPLTAVGPTVTPTESPTETPTKSPTKSPTKTPEPEPTVTAYRYVGTAAGLNVRTGPSEDADIVTVFDYGTKVGITGTEKGEWLQIIHNDEVLWLSGEYLVNDDPPPLPEPEDEISYAECPSGSSVESGLTPDAIRVHRAVCAQFPEVDSYGGLRSGDGGEHGTGQALDIMVSSSSLGDAIAAFVRDHYQELGVSEVIWSQRIWTVERAADGWRWMEDRGSTTANHYDHVHVTVYGDSGG